MNSESSSPTANYLLLRGFRDQTLMIELPRRGPAVVDIEGGEGIRHGTAAGRGKEAGKILDHADVDIGLKLDGSHESSEDPSRDPARIKAAHNRLIHITISPQFVVEQMCNPLTRGGQ